MASLEAGYPVLLDEDWELEPQGQLIWQNISFDPSSDRFTTLNFNLQNNFTGRLGAQLQRTAMLGDIWLQPRFTMNFWHGFGGTDTTQFNQTIPLATPFQADIFDVGGGVAARFTDSTSAYVQFKYSLNLDGAYRRAFGGTVGLRHSLLFGAQHAAGLSPVSMEPSARVQGIDGCAIPGRGKGNWTLAQYPAKCRVLRLRLCAQLCTASSLIDRCG